MVMKDGSVAIAKLGNVFMHPVSTCCTRTTFKMADILTEIMLLMV